ncbi:OmpG porin family protein [Buttiauxella gaviniae]|uniref:OmpG porin family protein n=1 Tax=Buttiauxella gaviniae TaxID=82990 RepID=UPI003975FEE1
MKNHHALTVIFALLFPALANASMSIMKDLSGKVVAVDPWSYLDEDVMWTSARSSNPTGGRVHGQLKMKYTIEDNNWRNSHFHSGKDSLTFVQGVMHHDALPGWYLAFSEGRTTNYNGTWEDQTYLSQNQWTQLIIGHEYFYKRLRYGWDVMGGSSSIEDRWQGRIKLFTDLRVTDSLSFFNYLYQQVDHRRSGGSQNDRDVRSFQIEPGVQYIINNTTGVWFRQQFASAILDRAQWGDIDEKSWSTSFGVWHNWGRLSTTLSGGYGHFKKDNAQPEDGEVFQNTRNRYLKVSANYPLTSRFTVSGEVTGSLIKQSGSWVTNGDAIATDYKVMLDYNF